MLELVPVSIAAGLILASAAQFVAADIDAVRRDSATRVSDLEIAAVGVMTSHQPGLPSSSRGT